MSGKVREFDVCNGRDLDDGDNVWLLLRTEETDALVAKYHEEDAEEVLCNDKGAREYMEALSDSMGEDDAWGKHTVSLGWILDKHGDSIRELLANQ